MAKGARRKLDDTQVRRIQALHANGTPVIELAERYRVSDRTIKTVLRREPDVVLADFAPKVEVANG